MPAFFYRNLKRAYPTIESGNGCRLRDTEGNVYLDGSSGAIVSNLGHGVAAINEAVTAQMGRVAYTHTSQFVSEAGLRLADKLVELTPAGFREGARVYMTSGGSESVETAMKMARGYFVELGQQSRTAFISRWQSYHGSTMGALSVTGHPARRRPYLPMLEDHPHISAEYRYRCQCGSSGACSREACSLRNADELEQTILETGPENVIAFIAEPIVGAALGAAVPGAGYWKRIREICTKYGVLLIADEVMTGLGRVGANFGLDHWDVQPDIIALGKGLSAGYMPLGAVIASGKIAAAFERGSGIFEHGFTYSGHPVACAAGVAALDYLHGNQLVERVSQMEGRLLNGLRQLANDCEMIGDVRGRGFLCAMEFVSNRETKQPLPPEIRIGQAVARAAMANGLIVYPGAGCVDGTLGDHIMIAPPFVMSESEIDELLERLAKSLKQSAVSGTDLAGLRRTN